jgi:hypothetical protein
MGYAVAAAFTGLIILNIWVSMRLAQRDDVEGSRKVLQIALIWLLPLIGAIVVWSIQREQRVPRAKENDASKTDPLDAPDQREAIHVRSSHDAHDGGDAAPQ